MHDGPAKISVTKKKNGNHAQSLEVFWLFEDKKILKKVFGTPRQIQCDKHD